MPFIIDSSPYFSFVVLLPIMIFITSPSPLFYFYGNIKIDSKSIIIIGLESYNRIISYWYLLYIEL